MLFCFFFFKQKTAYEMRISDWSSDVCSSDLRYPRAARCGDALGGARPARCRLERRSALWLCARVGRDRHPNHDFAQRDRRQPPSERRVALPGAGDDGAVPDDDLHGRAAVRGRPRGRKRGVEGKGESVSVAPGGRRILKKKKNIDKN